MLSFIMTPVYKKADNKSAQTTYEEGMKSVTMKKHREDEVAETIRNVQGERIVKHSTPKNERKVDTSITQALSRESYLRQYYQVNEVYAFTVGNCISDQMADGTQRTKYILKDKRGVKFPYYCDCTCFQGKKEVYLRIKEISDGQFKFENSNIERFDEIFLKGQEYEFEVISCTNERCVVCDVQIGKNHSLIIDDGQYYERGKILKLEVQGYDDSGKLLLVDLNPPAPIEPCINSLQLMAEAIPKLSKSETPQVSPKLNTSKSNRIYANLSNLSDTPKVAPSISIPREDKRVLVEDLRLKIPTKAESHVTRLSESQPIYTRSIIQKQPVPHLKPQAKPLSVPHPTPQPKSLPAPHLKPQPEPQSENQSRKSSDLQHFMAWMDGVNGMEKSKDYTTYSGHAGEVDNTELPVYQQKKNCVAEAKEVHTQAKPWYVRVWHRVKRYFCRSCESRKQSPTHSKS